MCRIATRQFFNGSFKSADTEKFETVTLNKNNYKIYSQSENTLTGSNYVVIYVCVVGFTS
jgi:hypothetical protein